MANLQDVYLYACVNMNLLDVAAAYNVTSDLSFLGKSTISGPTSSEIVFRGSEMVDTTNYFVREDNGLVWPGPVHYHSEGGYMGGSFHTDESHPKLILKTAMNTKIVDIGFLPPEV